MAAGQDGDSGPRSTGLRWNNQTTPAQVNKSAGFNAFTRDVADVPESDWDDFVGTASPAPNSQTHRAPTADERSRGYVRGRAGG